MAFNNGQAARAEDTEPRDRYFYYIDQAGNKTYHAYPSAQDMYSTTTTQAPDQHPHLEHTTQPVKVDIDRYKIAQQTWGEVFHRNAYTNFSQINYLKDKAGVSWDKLLGNPKLLSNGVTKESIKEDTSHSNVLTWSRSGRCTSFAVAVARRLEEYFPGAYNFKYYDLGGHRVARCASSGILIDSSSTQGAIPLVEGEWFTFENEMPRWKWMGSMSKFEGTQGKMKIASTELTAQECMTIDSCEIKDDKRGLTPLFFFRSFEANQAEYWGMLKWDTKKHQLLLIRDMRTPDSTKKIAADSIIVFDKQGTRATEEECLDMLKTFLKYQSGPCGEAQWQLNLGWKVNDEIWQAAKRVWGLPRLMTSMWCTI